MEVISFQEDHEHQPQLPYVELTAIGDDGFEIEVVDKMLEQEKTEQEVITFERLMTLES